VHLRSDSLLLVNQLSGIYRVKTPHLQPLHREVRGLIAAFSQVKVEHVPRERNKDADRLANLGVDTMLAARRRR
jgi:ribonuclease HI